MNMNYNFFKTEVTNHIAVITFSNPPVNAMCKAAYQEMKEVFCEIGNLHDVRCVILKTEGKGFIGGNDIGEIADHTRNNHHEYQSIVGSGVCAIQNCPVPVIGVVQGYAIGVGLLMAIVCDLVVAGEKAWFNLPEISLGILAGTSFAKTALPEKLVKYLCLTGNRLTAHQMLSYGAINFVTAQDELEEKAWELAEKIAAQPPKTVRIYKDWSKKCYNHQSSEHFEIETALTGLVLETPEKKECIQAFFEKRPAKFE